MSHIIGLVSYIKNCFHFLEDMYWCDDFFSWIREYTIQKVIRSCDILIVASRVLYNMRKKSWSMLLLDQSLLDVCYIAHRWQLTTEKFNTYLHIRQLNHYFNVITQALFNHLKLSHWNQVILSLNLVIEIFLT